MTVRVTQNDILRGVPLSRTHCPVARAIRRKVNTEHVHAQYAYIHIARRKYETPLRVASWMKLYDRGESVNPIRFEL